MTETLQSTARSRLKRGRSARGAAMVEAAIVISLLALGLSGLIFFLNFYTNEMTVSRLARGTAIAYAEQGCPDNSRPADWIGITDKRTFNVSDGAKSNDMAQDNSGRGNSSTPPSSGNSENDSRNGGLVSGIQGLGGDGKSVLNPITTVEFDGNTRTYIKGRALSPDRALFKQNLKSRSFVTCGETMKAGDIMEVFSRAKDAFSSLIHF